MENNKPTQLTPTQLTAYRKELKFNTEILELEARNLEAQVKILHYKAQLASMQMQMQMANNLPEPTDEGIADNVPVADDVPVAELKED